MQLRKSILLAIALGAFSNAVLAHEVHADAPYQYATSGWPVTMFSTHKIILRNGRDYAVTFRWWMDLCQSEVKEGCATDNAEVTLEPHTELTIDRQLQLQHTFYSKGTSYQTIARSGVQGDGATETKAFGTVVVQ